MKKRKRKIRFMDVVKLVGLALPIIQLIREMGKDDDPTAQ